MQNIGRIISAYAALDGGGKAMALSTLEGWAILAEKTTPDAPRKMVGLSLVPNPKREANLGRSNGGIKKALAVTPTHKPVRFK